MTDLDWLNMVFLNSWVTVTVIKYEYDSRPIFYENFFLPGTFILFSVHFLSFHCYITGNFTHNSLY